MIKEARSFGDLSENSEIRRGQKWNMAAFFHVYMSLTTSFQINIIIEDDALNDKVGPGSKVVVRDLVEGYEDTYQIVGSQEADPVLGRNQRRVALRPGADRRKAGEEVYVHAPAGATKYLILEVE
jgi:transcription elongation factor GreA